MRVAVLDTGVDLAHADFAGRINLALSESLTYRSERDDIQDTNGHGTHIAGIIGGSGAESRGFFRGIAPECELLSFRIARDKRGDDGNAIAGIQAAISAGAQVINFSHGYAPECGAAPWLWPDELSMLEVAFENAASAGILCVVAAGNAGRNEGSITRPGGLESVCTVGALNHKNELLPISGRGPFRRSADIRRGAVTRYDADLHRAARVISKPDVVAIGEVNAPRANGCFEGLGFGVEEHPYVPLMGTSQAAAVVSGLATLMLDAALACGVDLGQNPGRTIHRLLQQAAAPMTAYPSCEDVGRGVLHWPRLIATLEEFVNDPQFRDVVLGDGTLKLLES